MRADTVLLSHLEAVASATQSARRIGSDVSVRDLEHDSRRVGPGSAFIALRGAAVDGHDFISSAIAAGAAALIVDHEVDAVVPQLVVADTRPLMAPLAAAVHRHPSAEMTVVGVTGTNGKTTVTHLLESIGRAAGKKVGLIGTIGARVAGVPQPVTHTTPEATQLQRLLRSMSDAGVDLVAMEVSSHALAYGRADAIDFEVAAFTNLSQDHLDFHGDMEEYFAAKRRLFEPNRARRAVINIDDPAGARLAIEVAIPATTVGFLPEAGIHARVLSADPRGTTMEIVSPGGAFTVTTRLAGQFNAANALVAAACALEVGIGPDAVGAGLAGAGSVPGRFEPVEAGQEYAVIVDYAHTPGAIHTVIDAVRPLTAGRVIAVGGAGGDRDRGKRPLMGAALAEADLAIVTSDNPRSEDAAAIAAAVVSGAPAGRSVATELDRRLAIRRAVAAAAAGDVVLILGKGHETGQHFATGSIPFDDRIVAAEEIRALAAGPQVSPLSWSPAEIAAATGGRVFGDPSVRVTSVVTDSREAGPGALFVAMRGEAQDGHAYAGDALRAGAAAVLVEPANTMQPRIEVADTSVALRDLAAARRDQFIVPVIAVTGSTGKTSTKDLLAAALPNAAASPKSYNNEVGVPLTVLGARHDAEYLVVEVGSRGRGHIAWLMPAVRPDVAIVTNLGVVHLETFGTTDELAAAKFELVEGLVAGGTAVLPVDEPRLRRPHAGTTLTFGENPRADVAVADLELDDVGRPTFTLRTPAGSRRIRTGLRGAHQAKNAAAAVGAGLAVGVSLDTLAAGLEQAQASAWRMEIHPGRFTVVNDAYNANPDSVLAALETVARLPGRHVAVLGKMAELGHVEAEEHRRMGAEVARLGYAALITVGEDPGYGAGAGDLAIEVSDIDDALGVLRDVLRDGDVVLVKASRAIGLERLAHRLVEEAIS